MAVTRLRRRYGRLNTFHLMSLLSLLTAVAAQFLVRFGLLNRLRGSPLS